MSACHMLVYPERGKSCFLLNELYIPADVGTDDSAEAADIQTGFRKTEHAVITCGGAVRIMKHLNSNDIFTGDQAGGQIRFICKPDFIVSLGWTEADQLSIDKQLVAAYSTDHDGKGCRQGFHVNTVTIINKAWLLPVSIIEVAGGQPERRCAHNSLLSLLWTV